MKNFILVLSFTLAFNSYGQDLNNYSYVVIPEKFSFLKEADQYQLNSLTKFLFEKYGFEAFIEGEEEYVRLNPDRCKGLYADVLNDSGFFRTKLSVVLKDCSNKQVFVTKEGMSREKEYGEAYQESLREAFKSIEALDYKGNEVIVTGTPNLNIQDEKKEEKVILRKSSEEKSKINENKSSQDQNENFAENKILPTPEKSSNLNLQRDGRKYYLQKFENGFNLFHKGTTEPFAALIRSSAGNSFIYNSMTSKGIACLDNEGNLIIEILKDDGNSLETIVYRVEDQ